MTPELAALALAALLHAVHWAVLSVSANLELGARVTLGPRDSVPEMSTGLGRLYRAFGNGYEALILFTIAVVLVSVAESATSLTATCAWAFLAARVLYVPAYVMGLSPWRSVAWVVGFVATVLMIVVALV